MRPVAALGRCHRHTDAALRFARAFVPAVVALALIALVLSAGRAAAVRAPAAAQAGECTPGGDWGTPRADLAAEVIGLVNAHRAKTGRGALGVSPSLTRSAIWKARHMAKYGYFDHNDPAPPAARGFGQRLAACGYTWGGGENIAYGYRTPAWVMNGWLTSPGHRANIENASYRAIGVGVAANGSGTLFWVQNFGSHADAASPPSARAHRHRARTTKTIRLRVRDLTRRRPHAGRSFARRFAVYRRDGRRLTAGRIRCRASIGGRRLHVVSRRFRRGLATCAWRLPGTSRGKTMRAVVRIRHQRLRVTRVVKRRVL
jgi:uncharacterized protein YkwD